MDRFDSLTDAQRHYLRLVAEGLTSKQIAQRVGGSHHTINVEIGVAMRMLNAPSRQRAAAMLIEADRSASYEASYEAPPLGDPPVHRDTVQQDNRSSGFHQWAVPIPLKARPTNTLTIAQRLAWVLGIAAMVALMAGGLVSGVVTLLTSLGRLG